MAQDKQTVAEISAIATETMKQATEQYFAWLQQSVSAAPWVNPNLNKKIMEFAQQNIAAAFSFAQRLSQAKDLQDLVRLQTDFMQTQLQSFGKQVADLGEASAKAATDAVSKPIDRP
jgi:hypothetical protein